MGITINYMGQLNNKDEISDFCSDLVNIAEVFNWDYTLMDEDWGKVPDAKLIKTSDGVKIKGYLGLKGIGLRLHDDCETLNFFFDAKGSLCSPLNIVYQNEEQGENSRWIFVKTQFAPADIHITIIKLLKYIKERYIPNLQVIDEGEYWESEDKVNLVEKRDFISQNIDFLVGTFSEMKIDSSNHLPEDIATKIENYLKKLSSKNINKQLPNDFFLN